MGGTSPVCGSWIRGEAYQIGCGKRKVNQVTAALRGGGNSTTACLKWKLNVDQIKTIPKVKLEEKLHFGAMFGSS